MNANLKFQYNKEYLNPMYAIQYLVMKLGIFFVCTGSSISNCDKVEACISIKYWLKCQHMTSDPSQDMDIYENVKQVS